MLYVILYVYCILYFSLLRRRRRKKKTQGLSYIHPAGIIGQPKEESMISLGILDVFEGLIAEIGCNLLYWGVLSTAVKVKPRRY